MHPVSRNWSYVRPLRDACVATGMKIGRETSPWGNRRVLARALVVYECNNQTSQVYAIGGLGLGGVLSYRTFSVTIKGQCGGHGFVEGLSGCGHGCD